MRKSKENMPIEDLIYGTIERYIKEQLEIRVEAEKGIGCIEVKVSLLDAGDLISESETIKIPVESSTRFKN